MTNQRADQEYIDDSVDTEAPAETSAPPDRHLPADDAVGPDGEPVAQPVDAQSDSAPVAPEPGQSRQAEQAPPQGTATAPGAGDTENIGTEDNAEGSAEQIDPELAAEMERRHRIAMRLRQSAKAVRRDDPEVAEERSEAAKVASSGIKEPFTRGKWGDMVNFQCAMKEIDGGECPHATLSEEGAWLHYTGRHLREKRIPDDEMLDEDEDLDQEEEG